MKALMTTRFLILCVAVCHRLQDGCCWERHQRDHPLSKGKTGKPSMCTMTHRTNVVIYTLTQPHTGTGTLKKATLLMGSGAAYSSLHSGLLYSNDIRYTRLTYVLK